VRRGFTWHFRARLPRPLAASLGRHEVWRSLGGDLPLARFVAALLGARIGQLWAVLGVTSADKVDAAIEAWLGREVTRAKMLFTDDSFAEAERPAGLTLEQIAEHHRQMVAEDAERTIASLGEDYAAGRLAWGADGARDIAARLAPAHAERIGALPELRLLVMRLLGEIAEAQKGPWLAGDLEFRPELQPGDTDAVLKAMGFSRAKVTVPVPVATPAPDVKPTVAGRTLREAIDLDLAHYSNPTKPHAPTTRMVNQRRTELELLVGAFGAHTLTRDIGDEDAGRLVEALRFLPKRWRKNAKLGDGSIFERSERARQLNLPRMKTNTVNGHVGTWKALFAQEKRGGKLVGGKNAENPFEGKDVPDQGDSQKREGFNRREVGTIYASPVFQGCKSPLAPFERGDHLLDDWRFWLVILGAFTGSRVSEIAQLRPGDVTDAAHEDVQGKWFIAINRRVKNKNSVRHVPVHPELVRIGLIRLKNRQEKTGATMLLPGLPPPLHGNDHGHYPGRWVREGLLPSVGLKVAGDGLGMHAWRHTLATLLAAGGASDDEIGRILGHVDDMQTHHYGQRFEANVATMAKLLVVPEVKKIKPRLLTQRQGDHTAPTESIDGA
jgi:integrase